MFQLTGEEFSNLKSQIVISSQLILLFKVANCDLKGQDDLN
jgi:hypothetical protein